MQIRRRFKQTQSLEERLFEHAARLREQALHCASSVERERLDRLARHADAASDINGWLNSPGPRSSP
jgi:hypothetical protein